MEENHIVKGRKENINCLLEEKKEECSDSSSQGSYGDADHTYNPYSFKRLQNAVFKKKENKAD